MYICDDVFFTCRCIGSTQHLKSKFGSGYQFEVKLCHSPSQNVNTSRMEALHNFIVQNFPGASQAECFAERASYKVPTESITLLSQAFSVIEAGMCVIV